MKLNIFSKLGAVIIVLSIFYSCKKEATHNYEFINGTENYVTIYIGKSIDMFSNTFCSYRSGTMNIIFNSELFNDSSVVFGYNGKFYEERSIEYPSILYINSYHICNHDENNKFNCVYFITEHYILSLPEVEMSTKN